ncbi:MAG: DNA polymerase [Patescibacteria group bacterium]|nr:DNA polymerase [bacterium]MDZ4240977.1 DNA polymerase [Patescibacteria group bacterium]
MSLSKKKTLVLLDVHAIVHRAYHALPDFSSSKGEPTGALYGLTTMLLSIIKEFSPDYIVACFDLPEPTYRHEAYEDYKAGRPKTDEALVSQLERAKDVFTAFGIPMYSRPGFEADDMLGTIVEETSKEKNLNVVIASGDMDTLQLVSGARVRVFTLKKGIKDTIVYDEKAVEERFGFGPKLLIDFKGLRGDPSDNIIGIKGIGEKTATTLITNFGTIENIYKILKKNPEKLKTAGLSERIISLLKENEEEAAFSKMLATIRRDAPIDFTLKNIEWKDHKDKEKILRLFDDLDFKSLKSRLPEIFPNEKLPEVPIAHTETLFEGETLAEAKEALIALWLLDSDKVDPTVDDLLRFSNTKSIEVAKQFVFSELKKQNLEKVFQNIENPLMPVVSRMNEKGVLIDTKCLEKLSFEYHATLSSLEKEIWKYAGEEFNVNSSQQLSRILFEKLNLSILRHKKTSTGVKSTKESELEKMRSLHPIIDCVLKYRELQKLLSTYIDNIPKMLPKDKRLRATFRQAGTTTGRISSHNPNLQNIPIKTTLGRNIRNAFIAQEGNLLASFDYSQIELRIAAFLSGDKNLIDAFREGTDIHSAVASKIFNVPVSAVDKEMRRRAKVINFGILYGMGVNALKVNLGTDRKEAQQFYDAYFENFSTLAEYLEKIKENAKKNGFTETFFGRRRHFKSLRSPLPFIRAAAERMAVNAPFQGTSADIIKIAMVHAHHYLKENNLLNRAELILQVHDELVYEIEESVVQKIVPAIRSIMESIIPKEKTEGIPLEVNVEIGKSWGEMGPFQQK